MVGVLAVAVLVAGGYWFEPWRLFTTREVDERLPVSASADQPTTGPTTMPARGRSRDQHAERRANQKLTTRVHEPSPTADA